MIIKFTLSFLAGVVACSIISCNNTDMGRENVNYIEPNICVLFFTSPTCVPCEKMKQSVWTHPKVADALKTYNDSPKILNSDNENDVPQFYRYNIKYVPTTIVVDHEGLENKRYVGYMDVKTLVEFLD